jgi:rhamnose utilization protein RhaD (predicted bifunctional aldolase and dehydrogenase)
MYLAIVINLGASISHSPAVSGDSLNTKSSDLIEWCGSRKSATNLVNISKDLGRGLSWVQAGGGNVSIKNEGWLVIKASGYRLRDCTLQSGFVRIPDLEASVGQLLQGGEGIAFDSLSCKDRPSIETALHAVIPAKAVLHVHSVTSLGVSVQHEVKNLPPSIGWVEYIKPGYKLAQRVSSCLVKEPSKTSILLQNHGLVAWGSSLEDAHNNLRESEDLLKAACLVERDVQKPHEWNQTLCSGVLWPDEAVYLGAKPFGSGSSDATVKLDERLTILNRGSLSADQLEVAEACIEAGRFVSRSSQVKFLTENEVHELINWEAEKHRLSKGF